MRLWGWPAEMASRMALAQEYGSPMDAVTFSHRHPSMKGLMEGV